MRPTTYVLAIDIGQANDYTALVIVESYPVIEQAGPWPEQRTESRRHDIVHIERFRDLSYPAQIDRIRERYVELEKIASRNPEATTEVLVDATGVGKPILDALSEANVRARGVIITGGDTTNWAGGVVRVPKRELVSSLQIALQSKRLRIAEELPLAETLVKEFQGFRVSISLTGHARFGNDVGSWREAEHDDLVLATSLATWKLEQHPGPNVPALRVAMGLA